MHIDFNVFDLLNNLNCIGMQLQQLKISRQLWTCSSGLEIRVFRNLILGSLVESPQQVHYLKCSQCEYLILANNFDMKIDLINGIDLDINWISIS